MVLRGPLTGNPYEGMLVWLVGCHMFRGEFAFSSALPRTEGSEASGLAFKFLASPGLKAHAPSPWKPKLRRERRASFDRY